MVKRVNFESSKEIKHKIISIQRELRTWSQAKFEKKDSYLSRSKWIIQQLDKAEEVRNLNDHEFNLRIRLREQVFQLARDKESRWKQRSGCTWLKLGDKNTKYFHAIANGRKNFNYIKALNTDQGECIMPQRIPDYLLRHYKNLLGRGRNQPRPFNLEGKIGSSLVDDLKHLDDDITEEEVRRAIGDMPLGKASGPDGLSIEFYKEFWDIIKSDIMDFIKEFMNRGVSMNSINRAIITLIPKKANPEKVSDYRPISVINTVVKLVTKVMANRLQAHLHRLIAPNQTAFIKGRSLMESFISARELPSFADKKKIPIIPFKVDFEKAFDAVDWCFLINILIERCFPPKWIAASLNLLKSSSSAIKVNGEHTAFFSHRRGLRQGDPLSPMLFILVADSLTRFIERAQEAMPCPVNSQPKSIQFADDVLIIAEAHPKTWKVIRKVLEIFADLSGLRINQAKSTTIPMGIPQQAVQVIQHILGL